jgi:molybdopterin molybdotransferase
MIPVEEALAIVTREARVLPVESIGLLEAAGRVLAREVVADSDQPPFTKSMMDGFALRSDDLRAAGVELQVVEEIAAGKVPCKTLRPGEAAAIMTGAMLPQGADAVQRVERTESREGGRRVRILEPVQAGANVAPQGRDRKAGERVLEPGQLLTPSRLGALASVGQSVVEVFRRPRVAVAPTGDELVSFAEKPGVGQIRNSNGPALLAAARRLGAEARDLGIIGDDPSALRECLREGLRSDLFLLSGGVSMGTHDLVEEALEAQGVEILFGKVAIRPGKPAVFGRKEECLVFGLPGNPVSSLVIFAVLVVPVIKRMQGRREMEAGLHEATLDAPVTQHPGRASYFPARLSFVEGAARVAPLATGGSSDLLSYCRADALLIVPAHSARLEAGEKVRILVLE